MVALVVQTGTLLLEQGHAFEAHPVAAWAPLPGRYRRREPEATVLHHVVRENLATFSLPRGARPQRQASAPRRPPISTPFPAALRASSRGRLASSLLLALLASPAARPTAPSARRPSTLSL